MDNASNTDPTEHKPQSIFMKLAENFTEILTYLEYSLNTILKKKDNGDLIQIYPYSI